MPKYKFVNASDSTYSFPTSKGRATVQPHTRRVLEIDEELSDARIDKLRGGGLFVSKSNEHAQNLDPMSPFEPELADARRQLMVTAGQEREDLIKTITTGKGKKAAAASSVDSGGASPAPSTTPAPAAATTGAAGSTPTTTAGR